MFEINTVNQNVDKLIPRIKPEETHFSNLHNRQNILILSMSTLPRKGSHYCIVEKDREEITFQLYSGFSQLEPGTKFFISKLAAEGLKADKIIILTTKETWEKDDEKGNKSAIDVYSANIKAFIEKGESEEILPLEEALYMNLKSKFPGIKKSGIPVKEFGTLYQKRNCDISQGNNSDELDELCQYVEIRTFNLEEDPLQKLTKLLNETASKNHVNLFIDLQGGSRSFMFTLFAATTLLRDKNVSIKEMFAIKYNREYMIHPIEILNSEYAIIDLVSGIRAFSRYGKAEELDNFLQSRNLREGKEQELIEIMKNIDGHMQINNPEGFTEELKKLADSKRNLLDPENYDDPQFKLIVEDLKNTYAPLISPASTVLDQIKWFGEKAFITSALTFIEDKIPAFMFDNVFQNKVWYNRDLEEDQICKLCDGKSYYRSENNVFIFCNKALINTLETDFFHDICMDMAGKIIALTRRDHLRLSGSKLINNPNLQEISRKICQGLYDSEGESIKDSLLDLEASLGITAWKQIKMEKLSKLVQGNNSSFTRFQELLSKKLEGRAGRNPIGKNSTVESIQISRHDILDLFNDRGKRDEARLFAVLNYLVNNDYNYSLRAQSILGKRMICDALDTVLFKDKSLKYDMLANTVNYVLKPLVGTQISILNNTEISSDKDSLTISRSIGINMELSEFRYSLWEQLIEFLYQDVKAAEIRELASAFVLRQEDISILEEKLNSLKEKISVTADSDTEDLMEFARVYSRCRRIKDSQGGQLSENYWEGKYSYRNLDLYLQLTDQFRNIYDKYFHITSDGIGLHTFAGVDKYTVSNLQAGEWLRIDLKEVLDKKRKILNECILFYQALKSERNLTNHAVEVGNSHMDYRYIRKAVSVFAELCRRLLPCNRY